MKKPSNAAKIIAFSAICLFVFLEVFFFKFNYHPLGWGGAAILILFGVWRIATEKNFYQKARIIVIVGTFDEDHPRTRPAAIYSALDRQHRRPTWPSCPGAAPGVCRGR